MSVPPITTPPHQHFIRNYAKLAALGFNEMLFTHAGLSYTLISSLYLDLSASGLTLDKKCRYIALNYNYEDNNNIAIRYLPYHHHIKVRNPVRISSKAKLRSKISIRRYDVSFVQTENPQQVRVTNYEPPVGYKLDPREDANNTEYNVSSNGDLISKVTLNNPPNQVVKQGYTLAEEFNQFTQAQAALQRVISNLPPERAYIYEVNKDLRDENAVESFNNQRLSACKILLPHYLDGHIPASRVGHDMNNKSPADIAWALLYAIGAQRPIYIINCLKGLVQEVVRREVIIKNDNGRYGVNPEAAWGFEDKFIPYAPSRDSGRDIGDNALLGWAIVRAVAYLQSRRPLEDWSINGQYGEFKSQLTQLILAQGYLCAYAISRQSWWCCAYAEGYAYNYGVLSQRASYLTSLFLDDLLQVVYDPFIHQQAARLYITLSTTQEGALGSRYFTDFDDTTNSAAAYKGFWLWAKEKQPQEAYDYLLANYEDSSDDTTDTLVTYTLSILHNKLAIEEPLPVWVTAHRGDNQQAAMGVYLPVTKTARHFLPIYLTVYSFDITNERQFDLKALEALAQVSFVLTELRRMWPVGYRWGSSQVINSVNSVLGSMLQADANLYFDYFLLKGLVKDSRSLEHSQGVFLREWVGELLSLLPTGLLVEDGVLRELVVSYINRNANDRDQITQLLRDTLGYTQAVIETPKPAPFSLIKDFGMKQDTFEDYSVENNNLLSETYLNPTETNSIIYKPAQEWLADDTATDCSSTLRVTAHGGRYLRRVAGFPYRNVPVSFEYPRADLDVPINQEYTDVGTVPRLMYEPWSNISNDKIDASYNEWVNEDLYEVEGAALIKSIKEFIPKLIIKLGRLADKYLGRLLQDTITAGVKLEVIGSNYSRDYLNTFFVYAASSGKWRIDNINLFNNEDYDNDSA